MKSKIFSSKNMLIPLVLVAIVLNHTSCTRTGIRAGAAECNITPPVGYEIQHYYRNSTDVHDSLYARCLYLEDSNSSSVAIVCLDLVTASFKACDELREDIREKTGIEHTLINFNHSHSSAVL